MAKEFGSKADMLSLKIDEVSRNSIWREHCTKELHRTKLCESFSVPNPNRMQTLTEKPNRIIPGMKVGEEEFKTATVRLATLCSVKDEHLLPPEKYELPMTSAQEYGWHAKALLEKNSMFTYPRQSNEVTKYAAKYYAMTGTTPFSKKQFGKPTS